MSLSNGGDDDAMKARLNDLSSALEAHRKASAATPSRAGASAPAGMGQAISLGFRVMSEFVAAVVVSALIGWAIDRGLGSSPLALILFIGLGTAAGFWNVYRMAAKPSGRRDGST